MKVVKILLSSLIILAVCSCSSKKNFTHKRANQYKVLKELYKISGKYTISGIHNREPNSDPAHWTKAIKQATGHYAGLWSGDFLFQKENIDNRQLMVNEAIKRWKMGSLINIMWHACNPALEEPCGWDKQGVLSHLSDEQWKELLTDNSPINIKWKLMMDEVAFYLKQLQDAGVEVLFRPLHEMNQGVFWWGGRPGPEGTRKLYQLTHDYLTTEKGLHNLIWIWDIQDFKTLKSDAETYNPGDKYWDVLALDVYDDKSGFTDEKYRIIKNTAHGKPIAIGECQKLPSPAVFKTQPEWTFFMSWSELTFSVNTDREIKTLYQDPRILTLDELPGWSK